MGGNVLRMVLWNASGLKNSAMELERFMKAEKTDLALVTETWCYASQRAPSDLVIGHSCRAGRPAGRRNHFGVAALQSAESAVQVDVLQTDNEDGRFLVLQIADVVIVCIHLSPSESDETALEQLSTIVAKYDCPRMIVCGDFNARSTHFGDCVTSRRGAMLRSWADSCELRWVPPIRGMWSFQGYRGSSAVDLVFTRNVDAGELVIHEQSHLHSDHVPISCVLRLPTVVARRRAQARTKHDLRALADRRGEYEAMVRRTLPMGMLRETAQEVVDENMQEAVDTVEGMITSTVLECAAAVGGVRTVKRRSLPNLDTPLIRRIRNERNRSLDLWRGTRAVDPAVAELHWNRYGDARRKLELAIADEKRRLFDRFARDLDGKAPHEQSKILRLIQCNRQRQTPLLQSDRAAMEAYRLHFQRQFEPIEEAALEDRTTTTTHAHGDDCREAATVATNLTTTDEDLLRQFSCEAIVGVIGRVVKGKTPGISGLSYDHLKLCACAAAERLQVLFELCLRTGHTPTSWKRARICPVPKRGDLTRIENYRPISLTEVSRKIFEHCMQAAMAEQMSALDIAQGGFRPKRSTLDQALALHEIIRMQRKRRKKTFMAFLDIRAAYDSVPRDRLWQRCREKGVRETLVRVLSSLFDHNRSVVAVNGHESSEIVHRAGVLQGSVIAPLLYSIFIDDLPRWLRERGPTLGTCPGINALLYADDIVVVAQTPLGFGQLLQLCEEHSLANGYRFNVRKCVTMASGDGTQQQANQPSQHCLYGEPIPRENAFSYLGILFNRRGIDELAQARHLCDQARKALFRLTDLGMNWKGFRPATNVNLYKAFVRSRLEYSTAIWAGSKGAVELLQKTQNLALRMLLSLGRSTSISSLHLLTGVPRLDLRVATLQARYCCRWNRLEPAEQFMVRRVSETSAAVLGHESRLAHMRKSDVWLKFVEMRGTWITEGRADPTIEPDDRLVLQCHRSHMAALEGELRERSDGWLRMANRSRQCCELLRCVGLVDRDTIRWIVLWITKSLGREFLCEACGMRGRQRHVGECGNTLIGTLDSESTIPIAEFGIPSRYVVEWLVSKSLVGSRCKTGGGTENIRAAGLAIAAAVTRCYGQRRGQARPL